MNKWEQFEYILKQVLPSYIHHTRLSCNVELNQYQHFMRYQYRWSLEVKRNCGLYEEIRSISQFCGINWEGMDWTEEYVKLRGYEESNKKINPVYW